MFGTASFAHPRFGVSWLGAVYLIAGGIVAATHHYWQHLNTWRQVASAVIATILWPLLYLGINLHVH